MNSSSRYLLAASLLAATVAVAHARIERVIEKTFNVSGAGTLRVDTSGGGIEVKPSNDSIVRVSARQRIRANSDAEADELLRKLTLTMEQSGNDVTLAAKYERQPAGFRLGSWPPVNVDFIVSVPAGFSTELKTSGGGVTVGDLAGKAHVRTSGGNIKLGRMGNVVNAHTSGGSISLAAANGAVNLDTSGGNITVGPVTGPADVSTSGGNIKVDSVVGALRAKTSGGSIRAAITGNLQEDCLLDTSGGTVRVDVQKTAAFRLDASTSGGSVDVDGLTITLEGANRGRSRLAGMVNGGGPVLKLRSSGGSIYVRGM